MTDTLTPDIIEEPRALVVAEPTGLARADDPDELIAMATRWADTLKRVVENQHLYAVIQGKKYPQVEAWMTIGRMDNVVAREAAPPIRHEDGSYEAFAELVRLTDMAIVGRASALCGTPDDKPWATRSEPARRSMADTRAVSRAFRKQYSWIMALAGYQPTPAEEMPFEGDRPTRPVAEADTTVPWLDVAGVKLEGLVAFGKQAPSDGQLRQGPEQAFFGFRLEDVTDLATGETHKLVPQVVAEGALAEDIADATLTVPLSGQRVTVEGDIWRVPWDKDGAPKPPFQRLLLSRLETGAWSLPQPTQAAELEALDFPDKLPEAESVPLGLDVP